RRPARPRVARPPGNGRVSRERGADGAECHCPTMTVAICTLDRPRPLARALAALRCQTDPDFELVIVDNGPNRRTRDAVAAAWPAARYVAEPRRGIAHARNLALRLASGEIIAYTDDDCRPAQRWVESIRAIFLSDPTVGCVTGPIFPLE